jgi:hypothetical protein
LIHNQVHNDALLINPSDISRPCTSRFKKRHTKTPQPCSSPTHLVISAAFKCQKNDTTTPPPSLTHLFLSQAYTSTLLITTKIIPSHYPSLSLASIPRSTHTHPDLTIVQTNFPGSPYPEIHRSCSTNHKTEQKLSNIRLYCHGKQQYLQVCVLFTPRCTRI